MQYDYDDYVFEDIVCADGTVLTILRRKNGSLAAEIFHDLNGDEIENKSYDNNGQLFERTVYENDGQSEPVSIRSYNEKGMLIYLKMRGPNL